MQAYIECIVIIFILLSYPLPAPAVCSAFSHIIFVVVWRQGLIMLAWNILCSPGLVVWMDVQSYSGSHSCIYFNPLYKNLTSIWEMWAIKQQIFIYTNELQINSEACNMNNRHLKVTRWKENIRKTVLRFKWLKNTGIFRKAPNELNILL